MYLKFVSCVIFLGWGNWICFLVTSLIFDVTDYFFLCFCCDSFAPSPFPNDNQSIKRKYNPRITIIIHWGQSWAEASLSTLFWNYILVCAVVQKYRNIFSFKNIFFCTHFAINLFCFHNFKTKTSYGTTTAPCMWKNKIIQKKSRQVQIDHALYCSN